PSSAQVDRRRRLLAELNQQFNSSRLLAYVQPHSDETRAKESALLLTKNWDVNSQKSQQLDGYNEFNKRAQVQNSLNQGKGEPQSADPVALENTTGNGE